MPTKLYEQYGWKSNREFFFGGYLYLPGKKKIAVGGSRDILMRNKYIGPRPGGSLALWKYAANKLFAKGNEAQALAVLAGFAAVLVRFLAPLEGGVVFSVINPKSGRGKTLGAVAGISVWGHQIMMELTSRTSDSSRGITMGELGNLPCLNDELYATDPVILKERILAFSDGKNKTAANQDGTTLRFAAHSWQTIMTTTSNDSIVEILAGVDDREEAAQMRIVEVTCDIPKNADKREGDRLKIQMLENHGWAGEEYISWLVDETDGKPNIDWVIDRLNYWYDKAITQPGWSNQHRFWARFVACIIVAGQITGPSMLNILDFDMHRILKWLLAHLSAQLRKHDELDSIRVISSFLDQRLGKRLVVSKRQVLNMRTEIVQHPRSGELAVMYEQDTRGFYINRNELRSWVLEKKYNWNGLITALSDRGVLISEDQKVVLGRGTDYASGQVRCVIIDGSHPAMTGIARLVPDPLSETPDRSSAPTQQAAP